MTSLYQRWIWFALVAQLLLLAVAFGASGRFDSVEVNDTADYQNMNWSSVTTALSAIRTPGYPAFLTAVNAISTDRRAIPVAHYLMYAAGVLIFCRGLQRLTGDSVRAFMAATAVIYTRILYGYFSTIATDSLAAAVGLSVCGLVMLRLRSSGLWTTVALAIAVLAGWLIRPAYLFLIPLVPMVTWMLYRIPRQTPDRTRLWHTTTALLITVAPLLLYCSLRMATVGRFGIVSFGGFNLLGIAGQFLQEEDIPRLSPNLQPLATKALEKLQSGTLKRGQFDELPVSNYMRMEDRYDLTIWSVFTDADSDNGNSVQQNSQLRQLAQELIALHPKSYITWLIKASRQAARRLLWDFADNAFCFLLLSVAAGLLLLKYSQPAVVSTPFDAGNSETFRIVSVLTLVYCLLNLAIVIPVCPPLGRFTDAAGVLFAAPLAVWILDTIASLRRAAA